MKDLITFLITNITNSKNFQIEEEADQSGPEGQSRSNYIIKAPPETLGLIIGKGGKTIKNIRKIASVKGVLEKRSINISVIENSK
jgi:predicted RNA-binding protein YlqC (UPF0109 family)